MELRNQSDLAVLGDIYYASVKKIGKKDLKTVKLELVEFPNPFLKNFEVFRNLEFSVYYIIDDAGKIIYFQDESIPQDLEAVEVKNIIGLNELIEFRKRSLEKSLTSPYKDSGSLMMNKLFYEEIKIKEQQYALVAKHGKLGKIPISDIFFIFDMDICYDEYLYWLEQRKNMEGNLEPFESEKVDVRNIRFCIFNREERNSVVITELLGVEDDVSTYYDFYGKSKIRVGKDNETLDNVLGPSVFTYFSNATLVRKYTLLGIINVILDHLKARETPLSISTISDLEEFKRQVLKMIEDDKCIIDSALIKEKLKRILILFKNINDESFMTEELGVPVLISVKGGKEIK